MDIMITSRHFHIEKAVRDYINKKLGNLDKLVEIYSCEVVLKKERELNDIEVLISLKGTNIIAKETSPDIYSVIDMAEENVKKQIRRRHDKKRSSNRRGKSSEMTTYD